MKILLLLSALIMMFLAGMAQNTHTLTGYDTYFEPDTLIIQEGDTVEFFSVGYHSATEVDSVDWVNNTANHNGGFWVGFGAPTSAMKFTIDTQGTYYNICVPHAGMGMKSIIIVEPLQTGLQDQAPEPESFFFPNPAADRLSVRGTSTIRIYDLTGRLVLQRAGLSDSERIDISGLSPGMFRVVMDHGNQTLIVR